MTLAFMLTIWNNFGKDISEGISVKVLVVGAGLTGICLARQLAEFGISVDIIDRRDHIAGNTYDYVNEHGIRTHKYGAHIFHTNSEKVFLWLKKFSKWTWYYHRVQAMLADGTLVPFPPNAETLKKVSAEKIQEIFYTPYTEKMWAQPFLAISNTVVKRTKFNQSDTDLYFPRDRIQALPLRGYTNLAENIIDHDKISLNLNTEFCHLMERDYDYCFNSMCIDEYYGYCYGKLPYRSLKFSHLDIPAAKIFPVSVINFTHNGPQTRIIEWKNFPGHGDNLNWTSLTYETPCDPMVNNNERYYPVIDSEGKNRNLFKKYKSITNKKTRFIGRCGNYAYIDMDQAVAHGLSTARNFLRLHHE